MSPPAAPRTTTWLALAAAALGLALYLPTVGHAFVYDDEIVVVKNVLLRSLDRIPALFAATEWAGGGLDARAYRPLTGVTYALDHALSGLAPWSYHLTNALLHGAASGLVLLLALRLGLSRLGAAAAALLFAAHPIHVEAVSNVVGRKDVLATALVLAMLLLHRRAASRGGPAVALSWLAYAGAVFAKEVGVVGIALAALLDASLGPGQPAEAAAERRRRRLLYAGHAAVLAGYLLAYRAVVAGVADGPIPFEDNPAAHQPPLLRALTALAVLGHGLRLQLAPVGQSPDWSYDALPVAGSLADPRVLLAVALLAAWLAAGWWARRRAPAVPFSVGLYLTALLPASNLPFPIGTIFGERLLYLPSVGLALLAGAAAEALAPRLPRAARAAGAALVLATLAAATLRYSAAWADEGRLFQVALASAPRSAKVHHKVATLLARERPQEALVAIERAIAIYPCYGRAHLVRAALLHSLGRPDDEARALGRALECSPDDADALYAAGRLARQAGRLDEAAGLWRRAVAARRTHAEALSDLATYHLLRGEQALALELATRAVQADERQASAWYGLGLIHRDRGDRPAARAAFGRFVEVAGPDYAAEVSAVRSALAAGALP
jgi:protein O-mannosyl-transferase